MSKLTLVSALRRETTQFPAPAYVSPDGKYAYIVYEITATEDIKLAAEILDISGDVPKSVATLEVDDDFVAVDDGAASSDFTKFSIVQDNQDGSCRIRVLTVDLESDKPAFEVVGEKTVSGVVTDGYTSLGGVFLDDDKYVNLTAAIASKSTEEEQTSTLWLLDANSDKLKIVDSVTKKRIYPSSGVAVQAGCLSGLVIPASHGILDFNDLPANWAPKHVLHLYSVKNGKLKHLAKDLLPQGVLNISAVNTDDKSLVSVGTYLALDEEAVSPVDVTDQNTAAPNSDGKELRIYSISDKCLKLKCAKDVDVSVGGIALSPNTKTLLLSENLAAYSDFSTAIFQSSQFDDCKLCNKSLGLQISGLVTSFAFDEAGSKVVVASPSSDSINNNILVFKF